MKVSISKEIKKALCLVLVLLAVISLSSCASSTTVTNASMTAYLNSHGRSFKLSSVTTPKGSTVQTCTYSQALTKEEKAEINRYWSDIISKMKWDAVKKGEPATYNCHFYAWYSQSSTNKHWINQYRLDPSTGGITTQANLSKYWTDGSYSLIVRKTNLSIPSNVPNGSVVFYKYGDHSAIKYSASQFRSKWGFAGVYQHSPGCAPYSTSTLEYYKKT